MVFAELAYGHSFVRNLVMLNCKQARVMAVVSDVAGFLSLWMPCKLSHVSIVLVFTVMTHCLKQI